MKKNKTMKVIKDNEELKSYIKNEVISFNESIQCDFNIDVNASIKAQDINARDIKAFDIKAHDINAWDIKAQDINARDIKAFDINALDINAWDISFYAACVSYTKIKCKSIKGRRKNSFHKCLDGELTIIEPKHEIVIAGKTIELSEESFKALKESLNK